MPSIRSWAMHVWERISHTSLRLVPSSSQKKMYLVFPNLSWATWEWRNGVLVYLPGIEGAPGNVMGLLSCCYWWLSLRYLCLWICKLAGNLCLPALDRKENLVSTFGVLSSGLGDASEPRLWSGFAGMFTDAGGHSSRWCNVRFVRPICLTPCFRCSYRRQNERL